jgi:tRNA(Ile)-lysidine synthase
MTSKSKRPPTLLTLAKRTVSDEHLFGSGDRVMVACSGGPDSMALLHVLALMRKKRKHEVIAAGIDHGLRPEAVAELNLVARVAKEHDIPFAKTRVEVGEGGNLQERAREARHAALAAAAEKAGATHIALGHTADDRAETVLMRIMRGTGLKGLGAMPPAAPGFVGDVPLVRPLIAARRRDVMAHLRRHGVPWAMDPSNFDNRFLRVRVRREVLPLLEDMDPRIVDHLCGLSAQAFTEAQSSRMGGGEEDDPIAGLTGAQRQALAKAIKQRKGGTTVRVSGGKDLRVTFLEGTPVVFVPE